MILFAIEKIIHRRARRERRKNLILKTKANRTGSLLPFFLFYLMVLSGLCVLCGEKIKTPTFWEKVGVFKEKCSAPLPLGRVEKYEQVGAGFLAYGYLLPTPSRTVSSG
jgi:hypothetical protein